MLDPKRALLFILWITSIVFSYKCITNTLNIDSIFIVVIFVPLVFATLFWPVQTKPSNVHWFVSSLSIFFFSISLSFLLSYDYNHIKNLSPVTLSAGVYYKAGLCLDFRENETFKARNTDMMSSNLHYGRYARIQDTIILKDKVFFRLAHIGDTLVVKDDKLYFKSGFKVNPRGEQFMHIRDPNSRCSF